MGSSGADTSLLSTWVSVDPVKIEQCVTACLPAESEGSRLAWEGQHLQAKLCYLMKNGQHGDHRKSISFSAVSVLHSVFVKFSALGSLHQWGITKYTMSTWLKCIIDLCPKALSFVSD